MFLPLRARELPSSVFRLLSPETSGFQTLPIFCYERF